MMNSNYLAKFDELNRFSDLFGANINSLLDEAYNTLKSAYIDGWNYAESKVDDDVTHRAYKEDEIEALIFLDIDGMDAFDRLEEAYNDNDNERIVRIMSTEYHRLYNAGELDRAKLADMELKVWTTMKDDRVRETHEYLDEVGIPLGAEFITYDGDSADYPGGFSKAENNVNCRCWLEFA